MHLSRCTFQFKPINDFMHGDAGESEHAMLPCVLGGAANDSRVVPFEAFGEDVGIKKSFQHPLEGGGLARRAASFLVGDMDNFIDQRCILGTAEQPKSLFENRSARARRILQTVPVEPRVQLGQFVWQKRVDGPSMSCAVVRSMGSPINCNF